LPFESVKRIRPEPSIPTIINPLDESPSKRRRIEIIPPVVSPSLPTPPITAQPDPDGLSFYLYLSNVTARNDKLKKMLFMIRSKKSKQQTEDVVKEIQKKVATELEQKGIQLLHEGKAQMMLILQPDKNGDWVARSQLSDQLWSFKRGDYIKIDNHHTVNVSIGVHYYLITDTNNGCSYIEDPKSPKKYPELSPNASLEIGIDDNRDGRLSAASSLESDATETFAVTHNGKLVMTYNFFSETCTFSFKRKKDNMKKIESLDDFQKELFLRKCLEVDPQ